jgi:ferredoxin
VLRSAPPDPHAGSEHRAGHVNDEETLRVDPIACVGHGICAELLPELIRLDDWGYPILDDASLKVDIRDVRRAIASCPRLALRLESFGRR